MPVAVGNPMIFFTHGGDHFKQDVLDYLQLDEGMAEIKKFPDGEIYVRILQSVRNADVFIVGSTHSPFDNFLEAFLLANAAYRASARRITFIMPYLGYNRQDRESESHEAVASEVIARMMLSCCATPNTLRVVLFDVHCEQTREYFGIQGIVTDLLYGSAVTLPYIRENILSDHLVVASPDKGGYSRALAFANMLGLDDSAIFTKVRDGHKGIDRRKIKVIGDIADRDILFIDDMIDTGGTMIADAIAAKDRGARDIYIVATHGVFSKQAIKRLDKTQAIKEIVVTDTIPQDSAYQATKHMKVTVLPIGRQIARAIRRIYNGESLDVLHSTDYKVKQHT